MAYHSGSAGAERVVLRRSCLAFKVDPTEYSEYGKRCCKSENIIVE